MPTKKTVKPKAPANKTVSKAPKKEVKEEVAQEPVYEAIYDEDQGSGFLSGLLKFLIVLAVLDFLAIVGIWFLRLVIKIFT